MAEKTREQWVRAMRRWLTVGAVVGLVTGIVLWAVDGGGVSMLASLAMFIPMGAAAVLLLWMSMYKYDFKQVWGLRLMGLSMLVLLALMATSIGIGCLQGICGER